MDLNIEIKRTEAGELLLNTRDVALALGISQNRGGMRYIKYDTLKGYLADLGIKTKPMPEYVDAATFLYLLFEVNTQRSKALRHKIPVDVLPMLLEQFNDVSA